MGETMCFILINNKELWDEFVDNSPDGFLFHKWDFLETMAEATGYTLERYGIYDGEELIALFPIFSKNLFGFKSLFSPPPQTGVPYLGFIMSEDYYSLKQSKKETRLSIICDLFNKMVDDRRFNYVSILLIPSVLDVRSFKWNSYKTEISYTYFFDLSQSLDEIYMGFKKNIRERIKKANAVNLVMEKSNDLSHLAQLYNTEKERYEKQGLNSPLASLQYLEKIFSLYPENICLYVIYDNNRNLISLELTHEYNNKFLMLIGSIKSENNSGANQFSNWELIKKAKEENHKYVDFVGANKKSLCDFKSQFNPSLGFSYCIKKQNLIGSLAEFVYIEVIKKKVPLQKTKEGT
jgi:hypothetical protein